MKPMNIDNIFKSDLTPVKNRRWFGPLQVRDLKEIKPGKRYSQILTLYPVSTTRIVVTGLPYQDDKGSWWVKTDQLLAGTWYPMNMSLADMNVVPYVNPSGEILWNSLNWLRDEEAFEKKRRMWTIAVGLILAAYVVATIYIIATLSYPSLLLLLAFGGLCLSVLLYSLYPRIE